MPESTLAEQIAEAATSIFHDDVPHAVSASVRQRILDTIGVCIAARALPTSQSAINYVLEQGGAPRANIIGEPTAVTTAQAAFVNGVLAHSLDFDDTHLPSVLHPSASVVPAALATGQASGANGAHTIRAIAMGLEVTVRLGMAGYDRELGNSVYFEHGQHATSICGAMGSGVTAALLLGLDEAGVRDTLGVTASMASGIIECNRTGGTVKRLHCGWAAQSGVTAAQLVRHGFTGPPTVLEGRFGFFEAFLHQEVDPDVVVGGLGSDWIVPDIFVKPYPANHFTHTAIDAGIALRERGVTPDQIAAMTLGVPSSVLRTVGQPIQTKRAPETGYQAQFSGPYAVVAGLLGGSGLGVGLDDFTDELARDPQRRRLMALVEVVADSVCDQIFPYQFPAVLRVRLHDGTELTETVMANRGGNLRPLTDAELTLKFRHNAGRTLTPAVMDAVQQQVLELDEDSSLDPVLTLLAGTQANSDSQPTDLRSA